MKNCPTLRPDRTKNNKPDTHLTPFPRKNKKPKSSRYFARSNALYVHRNPTPCEKIETHELGKRSRNVENGDLRPEIAKRTAVPAHR